MNKKSYFERLTRKQEHQVSLAEAALHIGDDLYPKLQVASYVDLLESWGSELKKKYAKSPDHVRIDAINDLLFGKMNFAGNTENYYDPKNSFLNEVIDRRKGIPISLSVIFLELAWRMGLQATGVDFPGHFLVRVMAEGRPMYIDAFHRGNIMTVDGCMTFLDEISGGTLQFQENFLASMNKRQILTRMLRNLKSIYLEQHDYSQILQVIDKLILLNPGVSEEIRDRGIVHYQMQAFKSALNDFQVFLSLEPEAQDADVIRQYLEILREYSSHLN
jgi:regulator of sirC expression with transglutaminase-like and TPR domain